jgi:lactoylglutathione lyase
MAKKKNAPSFAYTIVYVPDVKKALAFWEEAFGLDTGFLHESGDYGELATGATKLAFSAEHLIKSFGLSPRPNRPRQPPAGIELTLAMKDVEAAFARAIDAGCKKVKAPAEKPWGQTVAWVRDLNGVLVELCTPMG